MIRIYTNLRLTFFGASLKWTIFVYEKCPRIRQQLNMWVNEQLRQKFMSNMETGKSGNKINGLFGLKITPRKLVPGS